MTGKRVMVFKPGSGPCHHVGRTLFEKDGGASHFSPTFVQHAEFNPPPQRHESDIILLRK
jgi:hypothetical protein